MSTGLQPLPVTSLKRPRLRLGKANAQGRDGREVPGPRLIKAHRVIASNVGAHDASRASCL